MKNYRVAYGTGISILCAFGLIAVLCAQENTAQSTKVEKAKTSTTKRVALLFTFGEMHNVLIGESEGRMITIENEDGSFGFIPRVTDAKKGVVALKVYRITRDANGESLEEVENIMTSVASPAYSTTLPSLSIKVKKVQTTVEAGEAVSLLAAECCIRDCGGMQICAECFECNGTVCGGNCSGFLGN
jgi:hypothetical protein